MTTPTSSTKSLLPPPKSLKPTHTTGPMVDSGKMKYILSLHQRKLQRLPRPAALAAGSEYDKPQPPKQKFIS